MGRVPWVTGEWPVFSPSFHLPLPQNQCPVWASVYRASVPLGFCVPPFSSVSSLPLSFLLGSSVLSFPVQIGLWSCCPKPFIWTVYLMVPASPGGWSRQEQARRESPVAPMGCWAQDSTSPESGWQGCKHTAGTRHPCHPSSCGTYPFMLFPLPPGLTKNVLSTVSPFPRPWGTERPWYECKDATSLSGKLCG